MIMWKTVVGFAFLIAAVIAFVVWQSGRVSEVVFHVPAKFSGPIILLIDEDKGKPLLVHRGVVDVDIPESGFLRVRDIPFLGHWITERAVRDGIELRNGELLEGDDGSEYLFGLGTTVNIVEGKSSSANVSFIGTVGQKKLINDFSTIVRLKAAEFP
jgi:hypothetical protein